MLSIAYGLYIPVVWKFKPDYLGYDQGILKSQALICFVDAAFE
jgi:hypothetical protein